MAPEKILLLPALFLSVLLLMVPSHCEVDPTCTTPAISLARNTGRGISAGSLLHRRAQCPKLPTTADSTALVPALQIILCGVCVPEEIFQSCTACPYSGHLCGGTGVICEKSDVGRVMSWRLSCVIRESVQALQKWPSSYVELGIFMVALILCFWLWWCLANQIVLLPQAFIELLLRLTTPATKVVRAMSSAEIHVEPMWLGSGAFSRVSRGHLSDNRVVAVKSYKTLLHYSESMLKAEVKALSQAKRDNIVELIGYCTERNHLCLVLELMEQRDLSRHIHPRMKHPGSLLFYCWKLRIKILLDVAKGLKYLHHHATPPIVHRDISSQNILIDDNWVAKLADFGTAVIDPDPRRNHAEIEVPSGTAGYVDPDASADKIEDILSQDVYSFGVVMMEVLTGRMAVEGQKLLANFAPPMIQSGNLELLLKNNLPIPKGNEMKVISRVAHLATECLTVPSSERSNMIAVAARLEDAWRCLIS